MIAKLGGDLKDGRGRSFKDLFRYLFFDKRGSRLSHRVDWAETVNCTLAGDPRRAWFEMFTTWATRTALKLASGIALTGRDNGRPVLHLSLAWAPHQTPDKREMMAAAYEVLDWLDLSDHQAVVVAHNDEPQPHIHLVVNTVHPLIGKTASLYQCKRTLSAWAVQWEERHGGILIESRLTNRLSRAAADADLVRTVATKQLSWPTENVPPAAATAPIATLREATNEDACPSACAPAPAPLSPPIERPYYLRARFRKLAFVVALAVPIIALFARSAGPPGRGNVQAPAFQHANGPTCCRHHHPSTSPIRLALRL